MRLSIAALLAFPTLAAAQGQLILTRCEQPTCGAANCAVPCSGNPIIRTSSHVRVELRDRVLRYEIDETFMNRGAGLGEADYIFPLPAGAAFEDLKLSINGELVSGETMSAAEARGIYEAIVRKHRDPALVEWMGTGLLRARIFPINPGEEKRVVVRFQTVAPREGSALRIDYVRGSDPAPRPQPIPLPSPRVPRDGETQRRRDAEEPRSTFTLRYALTPDLGRPYSPTHGLAVTDRAGRRSVTATGSGREVTILLPLVRANEASLNLLTHRVAGEDGFALITITPPANRGRVLSRDVTFVIDVSGSMRGTKLEQAKAAGRELLESLNTGDRFRLIQFATDVQSYRDAFTPVTAASRRQALRWLDDLHATGSTNISGALEAALDAEHSEERLPLVVFLTDGEPTVGERNPDAIAAWAARHRGEARIFTVGVSAAVNATLIEQLAVQGRGTAHFVRTGESAEHAVSLLASRLTSPVLTDVHVRAEGVRLRQLHPVLPADVFAGQDLVLLARYDGDGPARLRVEGRAGGRTVSWTTTVTFPARARDNAFVPRLWAAQRIGWLAAERRQNGGNPELDAELRSLGERFGIPTEFSSYLVLEPGMQPERWRADALGNVRPSSAPTPVAARARDAGEARFEAARQAAAQRSAKSLADVDAAAEAAPVTQRQIGTRQFVQQGSIWVDQRYTPSQKTVQVKAYSALYFELLNRLTGLKEALALGDQVLVAGREIGIEVGPSGLERMSERELADLAKAW